MIELLAALGGVSSVGLAIALTFFAVRNGKLVAAERREFSRRKEAEASLTVCSSEFERLKIRTDAIAASLISELERFKNEELDKIEAEPDRNARIAMRRDWIAGVLSSQGITEETGPDEGGDSSDRLRSPAAAKEKGRKYVK